MNEPLDTTIVNQSIFSIASSYLFQVMPYLPYEEPGITVILALTSFLLLLNSTRYALDRLLYCGIIGEILIGIIWGLPVGGTSWLSLSLQDSIQSLGYLGLIGLVFQGGIETDIALLKKNALVSVAIATVGLLMPIALSFILVLLPFSSAEMTQWTAYPTALAAFSAGASLCSTSLGTTFAILTSANLQKTRVGIVLVGAAMMDDVVGLVMVNIVTTLGSSGAGAWTIARPIVAGFGLLLAVLTITPFMLKPSCVLVSRFLKAEVQTAGQNATQTVTSKRLQTRVALLFQTLPNTEFIIRTLILIAFVTVAAYIDASVLFAAFIAGGLIHYLTDSMEDGDAIPENDSPDNDSEDHLQLVLDYILLPFFFLFYDGSLPVKALSLSKTAWVVSYPRKQIAFASQSASIGFSIPLTDMFSASIVWKGIVYTVLMVLGKGLVATVIYAEYFIRTWETRKSQRAQLNLRNRSLTIQVEPEPIFTEKVKVPHSAALLVGFAMVARGEIGFLIASLSQSSGTLTLRASAQANNESSGESVFVVIIWAVVMCTIIGPVAVGIIVRRAKTAENNPLLNW